MTDRFKPGPIPGMAEATRLTQAGQLTEATAHIQRMLTGAASSPADDAIEGDFHRLDEPAVGSTPRQVRPRTPLAETLRSIAAGGMPSQTLRTGSGPAVPQGASFTTHTHAGPQGSRDYMLFLPSCAATATTPLPLVVMLHGCTQSPADFATGTGMNALADAQGVIVAYPAQTQGANMSKCWNWFRPGDQGRDGGEPAVLAGITRDIVRHHNADPAQTYVAGLSAGAAAAVILAQAYPDLFAAVGVHSGLPAGAARDVPSAMAAMRTGVAGTRLTHAIPTIVFHGTGDHTVDIKNGQAVAKQAQQGFAGKTQMTKRQTNGGRRSDIAAQTLSDGRTSCELWLIDGAPHAWAGGDPAGSYTDPTGPDASAEMLRFFAQHRLE